MLRHAQTQILRITKLNLAHGIEEHTVVVTIRLSKYEQEPR